MKTRTIKLACIQIAFLLVYCGLHAQQQVSLIEAKKAAVRTLNKYMTGSSLNFNMQDISSVNIKLENKDTLMYEVIFKNGQTVLLSGSKACLPVLAVLDQTSKVHSLLNPDDDLPEGVIDFLETYMQQIHYCFQNDTVRLYHRDDWNLLQTADSGRTGRTVVVPPLLTTKWGQRSSNDDYEANAYNYFAPQLCGNDNCYAGCVAVAMAQIMNYWKFPVYRLDSLFDWCNMPNELRYYNYQGGVNHNYETERNAIASLIKDCGTAVNMVYCSDTDCRSSSSINKALSAFVNRYGYSSDADLQRRFWHNDNTWIGRMKNNLNHGWPIYYRGENTNSAHTFVCDGYDSDDRFHFNFGWRGNWNGFYSISSLNPNTTNYNNDQKAIFYIYPSGTQDYCNFTLPLEAHYQLYYNVLGFTTPEPYENVPGTFTRLASVPDTLNYPASWRTIPNGAVAEYTAHEEILLQNGFVAEEGSDFYAHIVPCPSCSGRAAQNMGSGSPLLLSGYGDMPSRQDSSETDITEPNARQKLKVYPNPVSGMLHIGLPDAEKGIARITVCDLLGRVMLQRENLSQPELEVSSLPAGMYLLQLRTSDGKMMTAKFVKE